MFKILFLAFFGYLAFNVISFIMKIKSFTKQSKVKKEKQNFRQKVSKMDIQDAEYKESEE